MESGARITRRQYAKLWRGSRTGCRRYVVGPATSAFRSARRIVVSGARLYWQFTMCPAHPRRSTASIHHSDVQSRARFNHFQHDDDYTSPLTDTYHISQCPIRVDRHSPMQSVYVIHHGLLTVSATNSNHLCFHTKPCVFSQIGDFLCDTL